MVGGELEFNNLVIVFALLLAIFVILGGVVMAFILGSIISSRAYQDAAKDRADLRNERRRLVDENRLLQDELYKLRGRVLELETQLRSALEQIGQLSATISRAAE